MSTVNVPMTNRYLVCTNAECNSNKFYEMIAPLPNSATFSVLYGRVNGSVRRSEWDITSWYAKYFEKIDKGYTDISDLYYQTETGKSDVIDVQYVDNEANRLLKMLRNIANSFMERFYTVKTTHITSKMIESGIALISELEKKADERDIEGFNLTLCKIYMNVPRKLNDVRKEVACSVSDFSRFIDREKAFLETVSGTADQDKTVNGCTDIAKELNISIESADKKECDRIKRYIEKGRFNGDVSRFVRAWKIKNEKTEQSFNSLMQTEKYKGTKPLMVWHGSKSFNFYHIIGNGLKRSCANSGMFSAYQQGLYFSTVYGKSKGYTSQIGIETESADCSHSFIALFDVAIGNNPKIVYDYDCQYNQTTQESLYGQGYTCIWAKPDKGMLHNDEVVIFDDNAVNVRYLVEIE